MANKGSHLVSTIAAAIVVVKQRMNIKRMKKGLRVIMMDYPKSHLRATV